jgi:hypothetical protein
LYINVFNFGIQKKNIEARHTSIILVSQEAEIRGDHGSKPAWENSSYLEKTHHKKGW